MKKQRQTRRALSVKVTVSETNDLCANIPHAEVRSVDVTAIRQRTGLSQSAFAANIGVPEGTLVNWEQGRRQPSGPAKVLLALLAKKPNLLMELYPAAPPRVRWAPGRPDPNTMTAEERLAEIGEILAAAVRGLSRSAMCCWSNRSTRSFSSSALRYASRSAAGSFPPRASARMARARLRACSVVRMVLGPSEIRRDRRPARYCTMYCRRPDGRTRRPRPGMSSSQM